MTTNQSNRNTGRGQGMPGNARGGGSTRPTAAAQVTTPSIQRGGITTNQSNRNVGRGFSPAGQLGWGQSNGMNTSFAGGTCS